MNVSDIRAHFVKELEAEKFTIDKTGAKTIEMIGASFIADEGAIFGTVNEQYVKAELEWYESMSTNINDIWPEQANPPKAWEYAADKYGNINSNYGKLIISEQYFNQYENAANELIHNPDSRRAIMIYNRPSIWSEFNENGKNDFICTNAVSYYVRDDKMHAVVQMRSNDVVFGYKNDRAWAKYVLEMMVTDYNCAKETAYRPELSVGDIYWQVQNLHVYSKHFHLVHN